MNSEDGKNDGEHEIDHIYEKIAGNFGIPDHWHPANLSTLSGQGIFIKVEFANHESPRGSFRVGHPSWAFQSTKQMARVNT